eukprot:TRINITY_DN120_c0_g1_i7.p1 TRINITY_DN120_c0_g1~~TRINITY_DN120_c0_g1_i7.p1  ORF type:complete len:110 (+),score=25.69 TRINITY_DN120_c0_g1_i7:112-441(+)
MEQADLNCDGKVDFGEFVRLLQSQNHTLEQGKQGPYKAKLNKAFDLMAESSEGVEMVDKMKIETMISDFDLSMKIRSPKKELNFQDFCDEFTKSTPRASRPESAESDRD